MSMEASSAQENNEKGKCSSPKLSTSELNHEFGSPTVESSMQEIIETEKCACSGKTTSEPNHEFGLRSTLIEITEQKPQVVDQKLENEAAEAVAAEFDCTDIEELRPVCEELTKNSNYEQMETAAAVSSAHENSETGKSSHLDETTFEPNHESSFNSICSELPERKLEIVNENVANKAAGTAEFDCSDIELRRPVCEELTKNSNYEQMETTVVSSAHENSEAGKSSCLEQSTSEPNHESGFNGICCELLERKFEIVTENVANGAAEAGATEFDCRGIEQMRPVCEELVEKSSCEQMQSPAVAPLTEEISEKGKNSCPENTMSDPNHAFGFKSLCGELLEQKLEIVNVNMANGVAEAEGGESECPGIGQLGPVCEELTKNSICECLEPRSKVSSAQENCEIGKSSSPLQFMSELNNEFGSNSCNELLQGKLDIVNENVSNGAAEDGVAKCNCSGTEQLTAVHVEINKISGYKQSGQPTENDIMNSSFKQFDSLPEDAIRKSAAPEQTACELNREYGSESQYGESLEHKQEIVSEDVLNRKIETRMRKSDCMNVEHSGLPPEVVINCSLEQLRPTSQDESMKFHLEQLGSPPEHVTLDSNHEQLGPPPDGESKSHCVEQLGPPPTDVVKSPRQSGYGIKRNFAKSRKQKHSNARVLRTRSKEKSKAREHSNALAEHGANEEKKRRGRKKRKQKKIPANEFSSVRNHLRYLLTRMNFEQNLIVAYSGDGWKGLSLEKVKPERELDRAKSEIFRLKLKIRDLFQRLDLLCAAGRLPDALFDSDGQIDSEDIFCAKCGSEDLRADNDIILCDGACERGFHQFCLEPPLLNEDIPPDDEGWLCPGCDCKVDCIDLLNESQGTKLSITDSWEKVFPEAATAAAAGNKLDENFGFPSDDSQDEDYDPDGSEADDKVQEDESSSEELEFFSASDDFTASPYNEQQYLGLPSDDSEDDDYNPNAPDPEDHAKQESSSSDFTSDSEDFSVVFDDNRSSGRDGSPTVSSSDYLRPSVESDGERSKLKDTRKPSVNDELLSLLESNAGQSDSAPLSRKRQVERLDYKSLHDDTYGNVSSDSSDEDWMDTGAPKRWNGIKEIPNVSSDSSDEDWMDNAKAKRMRRNDIEELPLVSPNEKTPVVKNGGKDTKHNQKESADAPKKRAYKKLDVEDTNNSPAVSHKGSSEPSTSGRGTSQSAYKRLGETVTQGLLKSFKENQYPERSKKETLAKEFGITLSQVSKWFENARWSSRHTSRMESRMESSTAETTQNKGSPSPQNVEKPAERKQRMSTRDASSSGAESKELHVTSPGAMKCRSGGVRAGNLVIEEGDHRKSTTPRSRKRKGELDSLAPKQSAQVDSINAEESSQRPRTRRRKSVA